MNATRKIQKGFTLVEILIVVIILGILAAIVIPQFTNASEDARRSSLSSQVQTLRGQVELFKMQHRDRFPLTDLDDITTAWNWDMLTTKTDEDGGAGGDLGPYMQSAPVNSLNGSNTVDTVAADPVVGDNHDGFGYVFSQDTGKIFATDKDFNVTAD